MKFSLLLVLLVHLTVFAQKEVYVYKNPKDSTRNAYLKIIPDTDSIKGMVVRDFTRLPDTAKASPYQFQNLCSEKGILTLYTSTTVVFPELFVEDSVMQMLDDIIAEVVQDHQIPRQNIFIGGISASGARALRYTAYCAQGKSQNNIQIKGAFSVDSPLDLTRFYSSIDRNKENFLAGMKWEADYMENYFLEHFKGDIYYNAKAYEDASVYSQHKEGGGNAVALKNASLILFHEPDIDWWLKERGCSYYDINSFDIAAFVMELRAQGNDDVTLITTTGKGFDRKGNRKPHSWTIVNEVLLMNWIMERLDG
ncbi:hypothetical protein SAMN05216474_3084 [Lishizhenia tianjinensis]|uniref:Esterase n=1 Tax=Lishizhenia tianjinensis TaxID=477690 RepID=A0A1I7BUA4_9FLAO|nr:hypothetical protein [Lishizhenia tianjinensis]SFT90729.1 hypothetical protein SAMN05216474_3084 [Lishizhenia tianjinensis]